ncbi:GNAT family N-acetyltransferase [candidate division WOR-3 bacterium]|nr:GNAT family N-acetyltransferase [candidate division WOR-3 bacterium]
MPERYLIRECRKEDMPFISDISKNTWDGYDFLEDVFEEWLEDGNFWVLEHKGSVIGTVKISLYPCKTAWLEGLRVHKNFQKHGFGRVLYDFTAKKTAELIESGKAQNAEFATYYLNEESLSLSTRDGFDRAETFTSLSAKSQNFKSCPENQIKLSHDFEYFTENCSYKKYIPVGWEFVKKCSDTPLWLRKKTFLYDFGGKFFIQPRRAFKDIFTPLEPSKEYVLGLIPAIAERALKSEEEYMSVMVPSYSKELLETLRKEGFNTWEEGREGDVLVMRKH